MKRIVLIDDSPVILELVAEALRDEGYSVTAVNEPSREHVEGENAPDLVLLDINMPQAFGDDVAGFLKDCWGMTAPIYLFSDIPEEELAQRSLDAGVDGYICKGWGLPTIVAKVNEHLSGKGLEAG